MRRLTKQLVLVLALLLAMFICPFFSTDAEALSRNGAVAWANSQAGVARDIDGNGIWCTDLATAYMNFCWLRANGYNNDPWVMWPYITSNANQIDDNMAGNPNWMVITRTASTVPMPGDIFVSEKTIGAYANCGHVGIILEVYSNTNVKIIEMSENTGAHIRTINFGQSPDFNAEHLVRFRFFEPVTPTNPKVTASVYAGNRVKVAWNDVGADSYYVYVENPASGNVVFGQNLGLVLGTDLEFSPGKWRVHVTAVYPDNVMKSSYADFTLTATKAPTVATQVSGSIVNVYWDDVGASSYYVYVDDPVTGNVVFGQNLGKIFQTSLQFSPGNWRVHVTAVFSESVMKSSYADFTIAGQNAPVVRTRVSGSRVFVYWSDVGASSYYVYVDNPDTGYVAFGQNVGKIFETNLEFSPGKWRVHVTAVFSESVMKSAYADFILGSPVDPTPSHTHKYNETVVQPTCTEQGYTIHTCSCGEYYIDSNRAALGHSFMDDGVCNRCGETDPDYVPPVNKSGLEGAIDSAEEIDTSDYTAESVAVLKEALIQAKNALSSDQQSVIDAAASKLNDAINALVKKNDDVFRFADVQDEEVFYFKPVYWAYEASPQITNGVDATHFGPDASCTRGQVVTFLWRAAGCPEPKSAVTSFKDVAANAFYAKAVAWAVENKITNGTSATGFSPDATCTRGQIVTFLWRFRGMPAPQSSVNPFTDVKSNEFYYNAVIWAVENNITNGISATRFAPNNTCTRGQIVTFLYRAKA